MTKCLPSLFNLNLPQRMSLEYSLMSRYICRCNHVPSSTITSASRQRTAHFSSSKSHTSAVSESTSHLPRLAQSSLWETIFPRALRQKSREFVRPTNKRPINPASYFIWIYLLIGSQAIRTLSIKNDLNSYMRRADIQIAKLREVVQKLQRGEDVDVEKILGTGDEKEEQEWEHALREIEKEDRAWQVSKKQKDTEKERKAQEKLQFEEIRADASPLSDTARQETPAAQPDLDDKEVTGTTTTIPSAPGFY